LTSKPHSSYRGSLKRIVSLVWTPWLNLRGPWTWEIMRSVV
jgi:hypothetical protein